MCAGRRESLRHNAELTGRRRAPRGGDRGREQRPLSPPSEPGVRFSRDGLSSQLFPHRDWHANRRAVDIVNSPRSAKKAFGQFV